jgi:methyl-accepting chemotaxis protein
MDLFAGSIRRKLLLAFFALGIVPVAVVGGFAVSKANRALLERAGIAQQAKASAAMATLDRMLYERYGDVQAFAFHPAALGGPAEIAAAANFFTRSYGYYDLMLVADARGKVLAANTVNAAGTQAETAFLLGQDVSGEPWFKGALATARDQTWVGDAARSAWVAKVTNGDGMALTFAAPVFGEDGKPKRVWCNFTSLDRTAGDVVAALRAEMKALGSDGVETVLTSQAGVVLVSNVAAEPPGYEAGKTGYLSATDLARGKAGYYDREDERTGVRMGIGYSPEQGFRDYKGFKWGLVVRERASDATALRDLVLLGTLATSLVIAVVGLWIARKLARPLHRAVEVLGAVAKGDLTARMEVEGKDELARMAQAVNEALAQLEKASENLSQVRASLVRSADGNASEAQAVASAAEQVGKNIETVAAGTEEMSASIAEITRSASDASKVAQDAVGTAAKANQTVAHLGSSSQEIGQVVKLIATIAEQTNLLALNATIEAARAGEAGKGFAVVAGEVKELARATAKATGEISGKVEALQSDSRNAAAAITEFAQVVERIHGIQTSIASAVEEQEATTSEMTRNVTEVSTAAGEIARSVQHVASSAQHTTQDAGQVEAAGAGVAQISAELRRELDKFRIGGPARLPGGWKSPSGTFPVRPATMVMALLLSLSFGALAGETEGSLPGTPAGATSSPFSPPGQLPPSQGLAQLPAQPDAPAAANTFSAELLLDLSSGYNLAGGPSALRSFDGQPGLQLGFGRLTLAGHPGPLNFRFDLGTGAVRDALYAADPAAASNPNAASVFSRVEQAYLGFKDVGGLSLDVGRFVTPVGLEVIEQDEDWNGTRGLLFTFATPLVHTGARLAWAATPELTATAFWLNGWNSGLTGGDGMRSAGAQVEWKPDAKVDVLAGWLGGIESGAAQGAQPAPEVFRNLFDLNGKVSLGGAWQVGFNLDYGRESAAVHWEGAALFARLQVLSWLAFAGRAEVLNDPAGRLTGLSQQLAEGTLTGEIALPLGPNARTLLRAEYRHDRSDAAAFAGARGQDTLFFALVTRMGTEPYGN